MWLFVVAALGELTHRTLSRFSAIGERRHHTRGLEQQALPDAVRRDDQLTRLEPGEDFCGDGEACDDNIRPCWVKSGDGGTLFRRHVLQHVENVLELNARQTSAVRRARGLH